MTVESIKLDNPLKRASVPREPMSIGFVPKNVPSYIPCWWANSSLAVFLTYFGLAVCILVFGSFLATKEIAFLHFLLFQKKAFVVLFAGVLLTQMLVARREVHLGVTLFAVLSGVAIAVAAASSKIPDRSLFLAFQTILLVWFAADFVIHFQSINRKINPHAKSKNNQKHEANITMLIVLAAAGAIGLDLMLLMGHGLSCLIITAVGFFTVAIETAKTKSTTPLLFIQNSISSYYRYPDREECVPGLIQSNSCWRALRPVALTLLILCFGFVTVFFAPRPKTSGVVMIWEAASLAYVVGFVLMTASLSAQYEHLPRAKVNFSKVTQTLRNSQNSNEQNCYFWGLVEADYSPIVFKRELLFQHAHILGTTGTSKTSARLAPLIEQTIGFGDWSLFFLDLKGDKLEVLASCIAARDELEARTRFVESGVEQPGVKLPIKIFTINEGDFCNTFNPFHTSGWRELSTADQTTVLAEALNLHYGTDWSRGHFSAVNADIIQECLIANPDIGSFGEFYQTLCKLAADGSTNLGSQRRSEYVHVAQTFQKLSTCSVLNATQSSLNANTGFDDQINLADAFRTPGIYYFHLPSTTSPFIAQTVARLVTKFLLVAAKSGERPTKVQIVIDEFQRMVSENLDGLFQMARSHDISLVIANQSLGDLRSTGDKIIQAIEGNCAVRQWLSVNSVTDIELVSKLFGSHKELDVTETFSNDGKAVSVSWRDAPRITTTNLQNISDDPFLSVTQISGVRSGYAQYGGVPFVCRSGFHISEEEYSRRRDFAWPNEWSGLSNVYELPQSQVKDSKGKKKHRAPKSIPNNDVEPIDYKKIFE